MAHQFLEGRDQLRLLLGILQQRLQPLGGQQQHRQQQQQQQLRSVVVQGQPPQQPSDAPAHPALAVARDPPGVVIVPQPPPAPPAPVYPTTLQAMKDHKDHPLRMKLEWDEIERAELIKETIEGTPDLDNISDFWYAQYALICKDVAGDVKLENVIDRAKTLQEFRRQYEIRESLQQGLRAVRRFVELCPNFILFFDYDPRKGNYVWVDNPANLPTGGGGGNFQHGDVRDFVVGMYYCHLAWCPDLQSIHKGPSIKVECQGMGWSNRHNLKYHHKAVSDGLCCVPFHNCDAKFYNLGIAGVVVNSLVKSIYKMVIEPDWIGQGNNQKKYEFGLTYSEGLDSVFLVPDAASAQRRVLHNLEESLRLRFKNEQNFLLQKDGETNGLELPPFTDDEIDAVYDARRES